MRRTKSSEMISRKDRLYFEDGGQQHWCSTCTSSSDDSDYDRWDLDETPTENSQRQNLEQISEISDRLARSRPQPKRHSEKNSKKKFEKKSRKNKKIFELSQF